MLGVARCATHLEMVVTLVGVLVLIARGVWLRLASDVRLASRCRDRVRPSKAVVCIRSGSRAQNTNQGVVWWDCYAVAMILLR